MSTQTSKIEIPVSFDTFSQENTHFVPRNVISPNHVTIKNWAFPFTLSNEDSERSRIEATLEANLADAMARVAEIYGISTNELQHLFPSVLRMLKSNSRWSK